MPPDPSHRPSGKRRPGLALLWCALLLSAAPPAAAGIDTDERVIFFPTAAARTEGGDRWRVPIHGWIFEPETDDPLRNLLLKAARETLEESLELEPDAAQARRLNRRLRWYVVDNEGGEWLRIRFNGKGYRLGPSSEDGHLRAEVSLPAERVRELATDGRLRFEAVTPGEPGRFVGGALLVEPEGVSVISDIDDTIKQSFVADWRRQWTNALMERYEAVPGMVELYQRWCEAGAAFHYVTASPWPLYPPLSGFMQRAGFPLGSFHMRDYGLQLANGPAFVADAVATKRRQIERLLDRFPERRFILIGDSTEHDPAIYAAVAREHPKQVVRVYIREVPPEDAEGVEDAPDTPYQEVFKGVPDEKWRVFNEPGEIAADAAEVFEEETAAR